MKRKDVLILSVAGTVVAFLGSKIYRDVRRQKSSPQPNEDMRQVELAECTAEAAESFPVESIASNILKAGTQIALRTILRNIMRRR